VVDAVPPIVLDGDGLFEVYPTIAAASQAMEAVDVDSGLYEAFDSGGHPLMLVAYGKLVSIELPPDSVPDRAELESRLRKYIRYLGADRVGLANPDDVSLPVMLDTLLSFQQSVARRWTLRGLLQRIVRLENPTKSIADNDALPPGSDLASIGTSVLENAHDRRFGVAAIFNEVSVEFPGMRDEVLRALAELADRERQIPEWFMWGSSPGDSLREVVHTLYDDFAEFPTPELMLGSVFFENELVPLRALADALDAVLDDYPDEDKRAISRDLRWENVVNLANLALEQMLRNSA
jgi:hypothetical protein